MFVSESCDLPMTYGIVFLAEIPNLLKTKDQKCKSVIAGCRIFLKISRSIHQISHLSTFEHEYNNKCQGHMEVPGTLNPKYRDRKV